MKKIEHELKENNETIKELFNFNGGESQLNHLIEIFTNYIMNSKNGPKFFIDLLNFYSRCRLFHHGVSKKLTNYVFSCFPEQINEIQKYIKNANILKFIIFPEEFPIEVTKQ